MEGKAPKRAAFWPEVGQPETRRRARGEGGGGGGEIKFGCVVVGGKLTRQKDGRARVARKQMKLQQQVNNRPENSVKAKHFLSSLSSQNFPEERNEISLFGAFQARRRHCHWRRRHHCGAAWKSNGSLRSFGGQKSSVRLFFYPAHCAVGFVWQASESARVCVFLHSFPLQKSDNTV